MINQRCHWTKEDNDIILEYLNSHQGMLPWKEIHKDLTSNPNFRQCTVKQLRDHVEALKYEHKSWTNDEIAKLIQLYKQFPKKWSRIGKILGRSKTDVRNRYKSNVKNLDNELVRDIENDNDKDAKWYIEHCHKQLGTKNFRLRKAPLESSCIKQTNKVLATPCLFFDQTMYLSAERNHDRGYDSF